MTATTNPGEARKSVYPLSAREVTERLRIPAAVLILLLIAAHGERWGFESIVELLRRPLPIVTLLSAYFGGLIAHELLHTVGYTTIGRAPFRSCPISFNGLLITSHCELPIPVWRYRIATALPGVILGLIPLAVGLIAGKAWLSVYGAIMTGGALGDARVLWALRTVPADSAVTYRPAIEAYEAEPIFQPAAPAAVSPD